MKRKRESLKLWMDQFAVKAMDAVGTYQARLHLSKLLERVANGERITITRRGVPVAVLAPPREDDLQDGSGSEPVAEAIEAMREFRRRRKGRGFSATEIKELIAEGRRF